MVNDPFKVLEEPIQYLKDPRLVALKKQRREALREEFYRQKLSPYSYMQGSEGTVFDPAIQRYLSTHAHMPMYTRWTPKSAAVLFGWVIMPMVLLTYFVGKDRDHEELKLRTGQISYADRQSKFW